MRRALLAFVHVFVLACGDADAPHDGGSSQGGASVGGAAEGGGGASAALQCQGLDIPRGDAVVADDGRTAVVACDGYELRATARADSVVELLYAIDGEPPARDSYAIVAQPQEVEVAIGADDAVTRLCTPELLVEVSKDDCRVRIQHADGTVLSEDPEGGGLVLGGPLGASSRGLVRSSPDGERYYGFGERTGSLDKRGRTMTFWNTDAYVPASGGYPEDADPLYQSIPFFVGLRGDHGYGVLLDNTHRLSFDMASTDADRYRLWAEAGAMREVVIAGPAIPDVVERYVALTGAPPLPPRWSLGYHQSRWGYYPDSKLLEIAAGFRDRSIPADGIWLDIQHMDGFRSFTWDPVGFPDPTALVASLEELGFKPVVIVDPAIKVDPGWDVYSSGAASGMFLERDSMPYIGEVWPGAAAFPDFTDPAVRDWWGSLIPRATDHGVRGLWIDMNEPSDFSSDAGTVPDDLACDGNGQPATMAELHNVYGLEEARATYAGLVAARPDRRPFVLSRAGYAGIQRFAAVWTGDAPSSWPTLQTQLPMILGMGLSGVSFVGSDVGGYSGGASPELFARWMQLGSISPFFRGHVMSGANDQEPWQFGTEVEDVSRAMIGARYELLPTLYSLFEEASRTGAPVLRPLVYAFQSDPAVGAIDDEAMLGPDLLVAPVLEEGATHRSVYLPEGRWFEMRSGAIYDGPDTVDVGVTLGALPMFVRQGGIVAKGPRGRFVDDLALDPLELDLYPGAPSQFVLYEDDGESFDGSSRTTIALEATADGCSIQASREGDFAPAPRTTRLSIRRVDHGLEGATLGGEALELYDSLDDLLAAGIGAHYDSADRSVIVLVPDTGAFDVELAYDPTIDELRPSVPMTFHVRVPAGTPMDTPIHIASSASGWVHEPLSWGPGADEATGVIDVPRGEWVFYKYTRGDWSTVEKWPGCVEASNRYELGAAHPVKEDTVFAWADQCL